VDCARHGGCRGRRLLRKQPDRSQLPGLLAGGGFRASPDRHLSTGHRYRIQRTGSPVGPVDSDGARGGPRCPVAARFRGCRGPARRGSGARQSEPDSDHCAEHHAEEYPGSGHRDGRSPAGLCQHQGCQCGRHCSPADQPQLAAIDTQLAAAQADAAKAEAAAASSYPGTVSIAVAAQKAAFVQQLQLQRNTVAMQVEAADANATPTVQVLGGPSAAVKVQPRPTLYAGVTLVLAALLAGQISVFVGSRRHLEPRAISNRGQ